MHHNTIQKHHAVYVCGSGSDMEELISVFRDKLYKELGFVQPTKQRLGRRDWRH
jgi:hypothetical protein